MRTVRLGDWASKRRQLSLIFQTFALWQQKCVRHHCRDRPTGRRFGQAEVPSNTKGSRFCGRGRETGNRDECHVHAPSTGCASCRLSSCLVRHRRVDRPCRIRAHKGVLGRMAASPASARTYISRHGFWKLRGYLRCSTEPFWRVPASCGAPAKVDQSKNARRRITTRWNFPTVKSYF